MIAPDFVTRGVAAPADDTLVTLLGPLVDDGWGVEVYKTEGGLYSAVACKTGFPCRERSARTLADAVRAIVETVVGAYPPQEAPHA